MWVWLRVVLALVVALMPGGFAVLLGYVATRTLLRRWRAARAQARSLGREASLKDVLATVRFGELVQEARYSLSRSSTREVQSSSPFFTVLSGTITVRSAGSSNS